MKFGENDINNQVKMHIKMERGTKECSIPGYVICFGTHYTKNGTIQRYSLYVKKEEIKDFKPGNTLKVYGNIFKSEATNKHLSIVVIAHKIDNYIDKMCNIAYISGKVKKEFFEVMPNKSEAIISLYRELNGVVCNDDLVLAIKKNNNPSKNNNYNGCKLLNEGDEISATCRLIQYQAITNSGREVRSDYVLTRNRYCHPSGDRYKPNLLNDKDTGILEF